MTEEERKRHLDEMFAHEEVIRSRFDPQDPVQFRVDTVVANIEALFRPVIDQRPSMGFITTRTTFTSTSHFARARPEARMSGAARPGIPNATKPAFQVCTGTLG